MYYTVHTLACNIVSFTFTKMQVFEKFYQKYQVFIKKEIPKIILA